MQILTFYIMLNSVFFYSVMYCEYLEIQETTVHIHTLGVPLICSDV